MQCVVYVFYTLFLEHLFCLFRNISIFSFQGTKILLERAQGHSLKLFISFLYLIIISVKLIPGIHAGPFPYLFFLHASFYYFVSEDQFAICHRNKDMAIKT